MRYLHLIRKNIKGLIIAFILLLTLPTIAFGAVKGYEYSQAKGLISEAKQLTVTGKFREAIGKLNIAESKWAPKSTKDEIKQEEAKNSELAESNDNFTQGAIQYEGENYKKAIEYFDKVIKDDEHYRTAQSYKEIAETKIDGEKESSKKGAVAGVSTQTIAVPVYQEIPTQSPTPIIQPTVVKPDNSSRIDAMNNLFKEIIDLNVQIKIADTARNNIPVSEEYDKCDSRYTYPNIDIIYSPQQQSSLISQCRQTVSALIAPYTASINSAMSRISQINIQMQNIIASCNGSECGDVYRDSVKALEAKGFTVVR